VTADLPPAIWITKLGDGPEGRRLAVKDLFDTAYRELGQGADFDQAIVGAIVMLVNTPEPAGEPLLLRRPGYLEHDDAQLLSLRPVQKQFLLIGPENRRHVLNWLRQVANRLDLRLQ